MSPGPCMGAGIRTGILPLRLLQLLQRTTGGAKNKCILTDLSLVISLSAVIQLI